MRIFADFGDYHETIRRLDKTVPDIVAVVVEGNNMDIQDPQNNCFDIVLDIVIEDTVVVVVVVAAVAAAVVVAVVDDELVADNKNQNIAMMVELVKLVFWGQKGKKVMRMLMVDMMEKFEN